MLNVMLHGQVVLQQSYLVLLCLRSHEAMGTRSNTNRTLGTVVAIGQAAYVDMF